MGKGSSVGRFIFGHAKVVVLISDPVVTLSGQLLSESGRELGVFGAHRPQDHGCTLKGASLDRGEVSSVCAIPELPTFGV
jgi:hypothetical protein